VGGTSVALESLDHAAAALLRASADGAEVAGRVAAAAADPVLVATSLLSPVTAARVEGALAACLAPHRLTREVVGLAALATAVRAATCAYRAAEEGVAASVETAQDALMLGVGAQWPSIALAVAGLEVAGVDQAAALDRAVFLAPWTAELAGGAEGLVLGAALNPVSVVPFATATAVDAATGGRSAPLGRGGMLADYEDGVRVLAMAGSGIGLLSEPSEVRVVPRAVPRAGARAPRSLADLTRDQRNLSDGEDYPGHVRVVEVPQPGGGSAWLVEVSGTQAWGPRAGGNPFDLTSDVRLMAQQPSALTAAAARALDLAQADAVACRVTGVAPRVVADEPVLLVGHSLGGIAASALAASPAFTAGHRVTHVVTMGSPVSRATLAPSVEVLSLEHHQDPVPRLDGQPNPDSRHWVTVTRDLADDPGARSAAAAHDGAEYTRTAALVDASSDASVVRWRESARPFFAGDRSGAPVIRDYLIERVGPSDPAPGVAQSEP
jgi:hypothetical protein